VSTDKAVNPANVMGATKRMCEMVVQRYAAVSNTVFAAVRFGNVLGSHGSVIPLFKRQLREGGPVTVTHRDITRYFMTIPEASRLVITAGALARGGEIFVLDMGEPVRIWDLAENLVRLSGLVPGRDVEVVETGLRPGEKMYEELRMGAEEARPTSDGRITVLTAAQPEVGDVGRRLEILRASLGGTNDDVRRALAEAVPTYRPDIRDDKEGSHAARP
ncbi:polysaccharide biosynthesis protein, partial [Adlercreutzia sp. ZJ242]|uniref:polysaccharide biosynthesis protein n=1 Tax=Adlercreutzia sp. ZJ242 TaxID=2709409 RepID=UPI0013EAE848